VPKLWNSTIEAHRRAVHDATLEAAAVLVAEEGLAAVTMSRVARESGIGRATLYKYFSDVEAILLAWHERQVEGHLARLSKEAERGGDPARRLEAVLHEYAVIRHGVGGHYDAELAGVLHRSDHVMSADYKLRHMIGVLVADATNTGAIRADVPTEELVSYCLHALTAAANLPSKAAIRRLVTVTLAGLQPGGARGTNARH